MNSLIHVLEDKVRRLWIEIKDHCEKGQHPLETAIAMLKVIDLLKAEAAEVKAHIIGHNDEESANAALGLQFVLDSLQGEMTARLLIETRQLDDAWNSLVDAQVSLDHSTWVTDITSQFLERREWLAAIELQNFPPQVFFSPHLQYGLVRCSICGNRYGQCHKNGQPIHIAGVAYMGKLCGRVIESIEEVFEFSIVKTPASKKCRLYSFTKGGETVHWMTKTTSDATSNLLPGTLLPNSASELIQETDYVFEFIWVTGASTLVLRSISNEAAGLQILKGAYPELQNLRAIS